MIKNLKLKKIGGLRNFLQGGLIKILVILLIATLAGYLGGNTVQKGYRNMTGYNPRAEQTMEVEKETEEQGGVTLKLIGVAEAVKDKTTEFAYKAIDPPLRAMDWAAFWFSFVLCFMAGGWLTGKLINIEKQVIHGGVDPRVVKNIKILEEKVNELVDHANNK